MILGRLRAGCDKGAGQAWMVAVDATVCGHTSMLPGRGGGCPLMLIRHAWPWPG